MTATAGQLSGSTEVTVEQAPNMITVTPADTTILMEDTLRLTAEAFDANGHRIAGVTVTWSSSDGPVATVSAFGTVTALTEGARRRVGRIGSTTTIG